MVDDGALNNIKRIEFYDLGCCYYLQLDFKQLAKLLNARLTIWLVAKPKLQMLQVVKSK